MARYPCWGDRRIQRALANLGHSIDAITVRTILRRHHREPAPPRRALVYRRCRTLSAPDRWLSAQGLFDPIEMAATMHRPPQAARLPTHLDLCHHLG
jgi:hypothetical protein